MNIVSEFLCEVGIPAETVNDAIGPNSGVISAADLTCEWLTQYVWVIIFEYPRTESQCFCLFLMNTGCFVGWLLLTGSCLLSVMVVDCRCCRLSCLVLWQEFSSR